MDDTDWYAEDWYGQMVYEYTLDHAIQDGELVEIFKNRWAELTGGKPLVATKHICSQFSMASLQEIWNDFVRWKRQVEPTLAEEDRLFSTTLNGDIEKVWVIEEPHAFTILFPEDY
jgi:hypothetical protein